MPEDIDLTMVRRIVAAEGSLRRLPTEYGPTIGELIGMYLSLPGLVGFWPVSSRRDTAISDLSGKSLTLTSTGGPTYAAVRDSVSCIKFNGSSQYLSRTDEAALSITGALTIGAWVHFNSFPAPTATAKIFCKHNLTANQRGFGIDVSVVAGPLVYPRAFMAGTVTTSTIALATYPITAGTWRFMVGRYIPSTEVALFDNGVKTVNTTSVPAAEADNTAPLIAGANAELTVYSDVWESMLFLCETDLSDTMIARLYRMGRLFFGV